MTTASTLRQEFEDSFLNDDFFSESVTYTAAGGAAKVISAVVYRNGKTSFGQRYDLNADNRQVRYDIEIRISSDSTAGIAAVNVKGDKVSLPVNIGESAITMRVSAITAQDPGTWRLGLSV